MTGEITSGDGLTTDFGLHQQAGSGRRRGTPVPLHRGGGWALEIGEGAPRQRVTLDEPVRSVALGSPSGRRTSLTTTIVLAEPRPGIRDDLADALDALSDVDVVARTDDVATTLLQVERTGASLVLVGAGMREDLASLSAQVHRLPVRPRMLFLDHEPDEDHLLAAVEAGVDGYTTGAAGLGGVVDSVRATARGESVVPPAMLGPLLKRLIQRRRDAEDAAERLRPLTDREREVLALLVDGGDHQTIATTLFISPETARTHVQRILRKLDVHSRAEAVELAVRSGIAEQLQRTLERSAS